MSTNKVSSSDPSQSTTRSANNNREYRSVLSRTSPYVLDTTEKTDLSFSERFHDFLSGIGSFIDNLKFYFSSLFSKSAEGSAAGDYPKADETPAIQAKEEDIAKIAARKEEKRLAKATRIENRLEKRKAKIAKEEKKLKKLNEQFDEDRRTSELERPPSSLSDDSSIGEPAIPEITPEQKA